MAKTVGDLVAEAKAEIELYEPDDVKDMIDDGEPMVILDVREPDEWAAGRLPGAIHIPRGTLEMRAARDLPDRSARIIVYCAAGARSALAAQTLRVLGYEQAGSMEEGFGGWQRRGYPEQS